jgi:membrane protein required for colicin V production
VVAYIVGGMVTPLERWPEPVREARSLPYIYRGAEFAIMLLPQEYRPVLQIPAGGRELKAAEFLQLNPQGRAIARP